MRKVYFLHWHAPPAATFETREDINALTVAVIKVRKCRIVAEFLHFFALQPVATALFTFSRRWALIAYLSFILALRARNPPMSYMRIAKLLGEKCNCRISAPSLREYVIRHRSKK